MYYWYILHWSTHTLQHFSFICLFFFDKKWIKSSLIHWELLRKGVSKCLWLKFLPVCCKVSVWGCENRWISSFTVASIIAEHLCPAAVSHHLPSTFPCRYIRSNLSTCRWSISLHLEFRKLMQHSSHVLNTCSWGLFQLWSDYGLCSGERRDGLLLLLLVSPQTLKCNFLLSTQL